MNCEYCNKSIKIKEDFGDLTYDCQLLCVDCLADYNKKKQIGIAIF